MIKLIKIHIVLLFCLFIFSCTATNSLKKGNPFRVDRKMQMTEQFLTKAALYKQSNELILAKKNYQLALTVDPDNIFAKENLNSVETELRQYAKAFYQKSLMLKKKGQYSEAKRYLLISLRYWPDFELSRKALIASQQLNILKFIPHTIVSGDTISKISKLYYGNFNQSEMIAQLNNIKDARAIRLGMKLKIPELKAFPFVSHNATKKIEVQLVEQPEQDDASEEIEIEQSVDPVVMYKNLGLEFYNDKEYENAVLEFKKVLNADPNEKEAQSYMSKAYYQLGLSAQDKTQLENAMENYRYALLYDRKCSLCKNTLTALENKYKAFHYEAGMKYYDQQNLKQALSEWELVQKIDHEYKQVSELLSKVKTIQKSFDALKKPD